MQNVSFSEAVEDIVRRDARYDREAYTFLRDALEFTVKKRRKGQREEATDVAAADLLDGVRLYALKEYGPMARHVLSYWGVNSSEDIGHLVFNLVEANVLSKTDRDTLDAFRQALDFDAAFTAPFLPAAKRLSAPPPRVVESGS